MNKKRYLMVILLAVSITTHFIFFGHPNQTVFDEVHFGKFASAYYTHQYYFDIHPPLGKLIVAGFGKLFHFQPEYSFASIGQAFPDSKYMALRLLPIIAGTIFPLIIFLLALEMGLSPLGAFTAGMLVVFDNALLTQSRYILLDLFLLSFGFGALWSYFKYRNSKHWKYLAWMGVLGGLSMSVKWTGIAFLGLPFLIEAWDRIRAQEFKQLAKSLICFAAIPFVLYFSVFAIHFSLLTKSGEGDAFMSTRFQSTLEGSVYNGENLKAPNIFGKFIELNLAMYNANKTLTATHAYGSKWYTWPFMARPIYYWVSGDQRIYLIGNPFVWWASTCAVLYLLMVSIQTRFKHRLPTIIIAGWALNYLPFTKIGRVMFLYHYLAALVFAIIALAYFVDQSKNKKTVAIVTIAIAALLFIYFSPLSYGLVLNPTQFHDRMWLESWQ